MYRARLDEKERSLQAHCAQYVCTARELPPTGAPARVLLRAAGWDSSQEKEVLTPEPLQLCTGFVAVNIVPHPPTPRQTLYFGLVSYFSLNKKKKRFAQ